MLKFGNFKKKIENFACKTLIHNFRLGECMNLIFGGIPIQSMVKTCAKYWSLNATRRYPFKRYKNIDFSQKKAFLHQFCHIYHSRLISLRLGYFSYILPPAHIPYIYKHRSRLISLKDSRLYDFSI